MGYHMVMSRREVLVQLDDDLMERLDALATDLGTNRSELIRRGAQAVLDAERLAAADRELRAAYRRQPADPALVQSARRLAAETAPAWQPATTSTGSTSDRPPVADRSVY